MNKKNRQAHLASLAQETRTMIFYEAPHKLCAPLRDLAGTFGGTRRIALCRELTKLHEEVRRTTLEEAVQWYAINQPKGEFVLVVAGAAPQEEDRPTIEEGVKQVSALVAEGWSLRDAAKQIAETTGLPKRALYQQALINQPKS